MSTNLSFKVASHNKCSQQTVYLFLLIFQLGVKECKVKANVKVYKKVNRVFSGKIQYIREYRSFSVLINICKTKLKQNTLEVWYGMVIYDVDRFLTHSQTTQTRLQTGKSL